MIAKLPIMHIRSMLSTRYVLRYIYYYQHSHKNQIYSSNAGIQNANIAAQARTAKQWNVPKAPDVVGEAVGNVVELGVEFDASVTSVELLSIVVCIHWVVTDSASPAVVGETVAAAVVTAGPGVVVIATAPVEAGAAVVAAAATVTVAGAAVATTTAAVTEGASVVAAASVVADAAAEAAAVVAATVGSAVVSATVVATVISAVVSTSVESEVVSAVVSTAKVGPSVLMAVADSFTNDGATSERMKKM